MRHVLKWFMPFWKKRARGMIILLIITTLAIAAKTLYPFIFKFVIDSLTGDIDFNSILTWIWIILGVGIIREITQWILPATRFLMNMTIGMDIRLRYFDEILKKDHTFFSRHRTGDLTTRLTDDIDAELKISWYAASGILRPVEAFLTLGFSIALMLSLNWKLTLIAIAPFPVIIWIIAKTEHIQQKAYSLRQQRTSETVDVLESAFSGIRIVIGYVAEKAQGRIFKNVIGRRVKAEEKVVLIRSVLESLGAVINQVGLVIILFVGGSFVQQGKMSLGEFYAFVAYLSGMTETIWTISWFFVSTKIVEASISRLERLEKYPDMETGHEEPWNRKPEIRMESASFIFPDGQEPVISNIDLNVKAGKITAVAGMVGSGKTTLLNLTTGFFPTDRGKVLISNVSPASINREKMSKMIGYVPQEVVLFTGTVKENILMGRDLSDEAVNEALWLAAADNEFKTDKMLQQGGVGLSGGQKARVALARALVHKPSILIMDDITSALDAQTEGLLWHRLRNESNNRVILVSTHREATAMQADEVIWLDQGKIRAVDTHTNLLFTYPEYRHLFAKT
ncbi:MAG TPA: ABC transporter ATP-binding protein [Candidatus Marinimicrobia bacterium]|nr:ABC transporter ATP-binding protein [Candidatus Neomarinimicrobiota bacterium]